MNRWLLIAAMLVLAIAVGYAVDALLLRPMVSVSRVVEAPVIQAFYATGSLQPDREHKLRTNLEGTLDRVLVDKGDRVNAGQVVAEIASDDLRLRYRQALAEHELAAKLADEKTSPIVREFDARIQAAGEQVDSARNDLDRARRLLESEASSRSDFDRANERYQEFWSKLESLKTQRQTRLLELARDAQVTKAALEIAQWNLDRQAVKSPIDGVVLDRPLAAGTYLRMTNDYILSVADVTYDKLILRASVDEEDRTQVRLGQKVNLTLYAYGTRLFAGHVQRIYPQADPDRRTFEVDVRVDSPDAGFSAGMTGELAFVIDQKEKASVVPTQAVQGGHVWTIDRGQLKKNAVKVGLKNVKRTEILSGISLADRVVVSPIGSLKSGQAVRVIEVDPDQAAGMNPEPPAEQAFRSFN